MIKPLQQFGILSRLMLLLLASCMMLSMEATAQDVEPSIETQNETDHDAFAPIDSSMVELPEDDEEPANRTWTAPPPGLWEADSLKDLRNREGYGYMTWIDSLIRSRKAEAPPKTPDVGRPIPEAGFSFRILLFALLGVLVIWAVSYFILGKKGLFTRGKVYDPSDTFEPEEIPETADNNSLQKAIADGDFRRAVRLLFLMSLDHLQHQGYIAMAPQKTNQHYLSEIADPALRKEFARMVLQYEYVWYGHFKLNADQFQRIHEPFKSFLRR